MIQYDFTSKQWCSGIGSCGECTLDEAKLKVISDVEQFAHDLRFFFCSASSPYEAASWTIKRAEANLYPAPESSLPMLALEAHIRGVPLSTIVDKVIQNGNKLSMLEASISGVSGKHRDIISNLNIVDDVLNYDWSAGWPLG
jgi:hypothetical protein